MQVPRTHRHSSQRRGLFTGLCFLSLTLALLSAPGRPLHAAPVIALKNAYSYPSLAGHRNAAIYVTVENRGEEPVVITDVEAARGERTMLHATRTDARGVTRMRHVPSLTIGPGEAKELAPGGLHVMVMGLSEPLKPGQKLGVTLHLKSGRSLPFQARVRAR